MGLSFAGLLIIVVILVNIGLYFRSTPLFQGLPTLRNLFSFDITVPEIQFPKGATSSGSVISSPQTSEVPEGFTKRQLSPYFDKIRFQSVSPNTGQITLSATLDNTAVVNITGWTIQTRLSQQRIPQAVGVYEPFGVSSLQPVQLLNHSMVYFYEGISPVGFNFRLNSCTGYLKNSFPSLHDQLSQTCPLPYRTRTDLYALSGACHQYVLSLGTCESPGTLPTEITADSQCRQYLSGINYPGCYQQHRRDANFLTDNWAIWFGVRTLDPIHDRVLLFDNDKKLVDEYRY